ncbi:MAG: transposase [Aestuariivita sp.]|nr:transposase [Aestuariivita sp.]
MRPLKPSGYLRCQTSCGSWVSINGSKPVLWRLLSVGWPSRAPNAPPINGSENPVPLVSCSGSILEHSAIWPYTVRPINFAGINASLRHLSSPWLKRCLISNRSFTLYDLTNTYFEGQAAAQPKAKRGHSKEKRQDAPLLTLGVVVDGSGFLKRTEIFPGNVVAAKTLATMLAALKAPNGGIVVMDRGIATDANLAWMRSQGCDYLVVSRSPTRVFDPPAADPTIITAGKGEIAAYLEQQDRTEDDRTAYQEVLLRCFSNAGQPKESGMMARFQDRFETGLPALPAVAPNPAPKKRWRQLSAGLVACKKPMPSSPNIIRSRLSPIRLSKKPLPLHGNCSRRRVQ